MKTTIDYCTGIHPSGMRETRLLEITTELPENDFPTEDKPRVLASLHAFEVALAEARSRRNASGLADGVEMDAWLEAHEIELFDAGQEDADTFCEVYSRLTAELAAIAEVRG